MPVLTDLYHKHSFMPSMWKFQKISADFYDVVLIAKALPT